MSKRKYSRMKMVAFHLPFPIRTFSQSLSAFRGTQRIYLRRSFRKPCTVWRASAAQPESEFSEEEKSEEYFNSPAAAVRAWEQSRQVSTTLDLSRRFVSILCISSDCHRALIAEKVFTILAQRLSISRKLLVLSAGLDCAAGQRLPRRLIVAAANHGVDLTEDRPCAVFDITDLDYYDYIVVMDRNIKEKLLHRASVQARHTGGHFYDWERRIRLLADFDGSRMGARRSAGAPLDVPKLSATNDLTATVECLQDSCWRTLMTLMAAGL